MFDWMIALQVGIFGRDFDRWWRNTFSNPDQNIFDIIGDSLGLIAIAIGFIVALIVIARVIKAETSYVKPTGHLGIFALNFRNQRIVGFVNKNDDITNTDALERLKEIDKDFVLPIDELKKWIEDGSFYAYDMRIIKRFRAILEGGRKAIILSPVPIEDSYVSKESDRGEASIIGTSKDLFKIFPKGVLLSEFSKRLAEKDYFGKKINVFILAPYVDTSDRKYRYDPNLEKIVTSPIHGKTSYINVITFPQRYYQPLANMASKMAILTKLENKIGMLQNQVKNLHGLNKKLNDENMAKHSENQQLVNMAKIHAFVKGGQMILPLTTSGKIAIAVGSAFAGFASYGIAQMDYFDALRGAEYIFLIPVIIILYAVLKSQEKSGQELMQQYDKTGSGMTRY